METPYTPEFFGGDKILREVAALEGKLENRNAILESLRKFYPVFNDKGEFIEEHWTARELEFLKGKRHSIKGKLTLFTAEEIKALKSMAKNGSVLDDEGNPKPDLHKISWTTLDDNGDRCITFKVFDRKRRKFLSTLQSEGNNLIESVESKKVAPFKVNDEAA